MRDGKPSMVRPLDLRAAGIWVHQCLAMLGVSSRASHSCSKAGMNAPPHNAQQGSYDLLASLLQVTRL